jgi:hypothetical protein
MLKAFMDFIEKLAEFFEGEFCIKCNKVRTKSLTRLCTSCYLNEKIKIQPKINCPLCQKDMKLKAGLDYFFYKCGCGAEFITGEEGKKRDEWIPNPFLNEPKIG